MGSRWARRQWWGRVLWEPGDLHQSRTQKAAVEMSDLQLTVMAIVKLSCSMEMNSMSEKCNEARTCQVDQREPDEHGMYCRAL